MYPTNSDQIVICPNCGAKIPLTEALLQSFQEKWRKGIEIEYEQKMKSKLDIEKKTIEKELREQVEKNYALEHEDLQKQLKEKDEALKKMRDAELALRKERRQLQENQKAFDLEVERKVDERVQKIGEGYALKLVEKDQQIRKMQQRIDDLQRSAGQMTSQTLGDALEYDLYDILKSEFPDDKIMLVRKGAKGADIIQTVIRLGQPYGTILWETKNTKKWTDVWISKLKNDQRERKAEIAVLVSTTLPEDTKSFDIRNDIWITCFSSAPHLAIVLRENLIEVITTRLAMTGKNEKMESLYNYFASHEFKQRIEPIIEAFFSLQRELEEERVAFQTKWARREMEIKRAIQGAAGFYGDIKGIVGASLPLIERLKLPDQTET